MSEIKRKRAMCLRNRYMKLYKITLDDFDDEDFVMFMREHVAPSVVASTWSVYKASMKGFISDESYFLLQAIPAQKRQGKRRQTSSQRAKNLPPEDFKKLMLLAPKKVRKDSPRTLVILALHVGLLTGMRPHEWRLARFVDDVLVIENMKLNKCTDKIWPARQLVMSHLDKEDKDLIIKLLETIQQVDDDLEFAKLEKSMMAWLSSANKKIFPRRKRKITLLSARHQFIANLKKSGEYSPAEIAYLVGHASDWRAFESYGRKSSGLTDVCLPTIPLGQMSEVAKIAQHFDIKVQKRGLKSRTLSFDMS